MAWIVLGPGSSSWDEAWRGLSTWLVQHGLGDGTDTTQEHRESGEVWQYLGTVEGFHEFRHRWHPVTGRRVYARVPLAFGLGVVLDGGP